MLHNFLSHTYTDALCDRDFKEWHGGIPFYGFWAILIDQPEYLSVFSKAQNHLQGFFLPGYARQAHITLNACGLISETHFSKDALIKQISALKEMHLSPFDIAASHLDSFTTAAYLSISDETGTLCKIHNTLSDISNDSRPDSFQAHITLGLYRDKFESATVAEEIIKFGDIHISPLLIREIQFCRYQTSNIQGPIEVVKRIQL